MTSAIRAFIKRSIEGVRTESERLREIEPDKLHFQDILGFFIRTWPYIYPMRWHALVYIIVSIFQILWTIGTAFISVGLIFNSVITRSPVSPIAARLLFLDPDKWVNVEFLTRAQRLEIIPMVVIFGIIGYAVGIGVGHANAYYRVWILQNINQHLRLHIMSQLQGLSLKFHAESKTGDAIYRLFQDSAMVTQILETLLVEPMLAIIRFFIGVTIVTAFSPILGLVILLTWVPMIYISRRLTVPLRERFKEARERNSDLTSNIQETVEGIRTIKVNGLEAQRQEMFEKHSASALMAAHDARILMMLFVFSVFIFGAIPLAFVELRAALFAYQGAEVFMRDLLLSFGFAVWNFGGQDQARARAKLAIGNTEWLVILWGAIQDMAMGLNRVYQILDVTPDIQNKPGAVELRKVENEIKFQNVVFNYPDRDLFSNITFETKVGEITAIMGPTGTGKTTLTLLLLRMFEYQGGRIDLDGREIRDYTFQSIRRNITLATQENILFSMSVMDNIRFARPDATDDEVQEAARVACADEFIERLPQKYHTFLGEKAAKLSAGQRQRLVIARAILKDTPILILDEPTASLDALTEQRIMANIKSWAEQRTVFLITHRLSTIRQADKIIFLRDGQVENFGSHTELMAYTSAYKSFVEAELNVAGTAG